MKGSKRSEVLKIIKVIILLILILFIFACYKVDFVKNNKYVVAVKAKIKESVDGIVKSTSGSFSSLVENYEPNEIDDTVYEITDTQNRYYYNQLDESSKIIYAEILKNLDRIKDGEDYIRISSKLSVVSNNSMSDELMQAFQNAWDAFRNDNVDVFYIDGAKMCLVTKTITKGKNTSQEFYISRGQNSNYLIKGLNNSTEVDEAVNYITTYENEILSTFSGNNDYYKIVETHNWIVDNLEYNMKDEQHNTNIYGALKNKKVVCEGYARLFKSLMDKLDIPCVLVSGEGIDLDTGARENHVWNYVYLRGQWYAIDTTWDDPVVIGKGIVKTDFKYKYFLKGLSNFSESHIPDGRLVEKGMEFKYPNLAIEDYIKENNN